MLLLFVKTGVGMFFGLPSIQSVIDSITIEQCAHTRAFFGSLNVNALVLMRNRSCFSDLFSIKMVYLY